MMSRRFGIAGLSFLGVLSVSLGIEAQTIKMTGSNPAASAVVEGPSTEFFVRFDHPVDHLHSLLTVTNGDKVIQTLHPRAGTAQDVLFSRAPTLAPGDYKLHWSVKSMSGNNMTEGDIPFTVSGSK
jgi:methionine-rich copper-binding protein CopC